MTPKFLFHIGLDFEPDFIIHTAHPRFFAIVIGPAQRPEEFGYQPPTAGAWINNGDQMCVIEWLDVPVETNPAGLMSAAADAYVNYLEELDLEDD